jgi:hypothetical protein
MANPNFTKGNKIATGRPKGAENKATKRVREAIANFAEVNVENFSKWVTRVAEDDPKGAADLFLKAIEYHLPKLQRTEVTGLEGDDIKTTTTLDLSKLTTEQLKAIQAAKNEHQIK